jgi:hypothetical protein
MSSELKLPSHIYREIPHRPQPTKEFMSNLANEELNNHLVDLNNKVNDCLNNQNIILNILRKVEKKLEEFE